MEEIDECSTCEEEVEEEDTATQEALDDLQREHFRSNRSN